MLEYGWKRLLSAFLALVLVAGMLPAQALATEAEPETQTTVEEETTAGTTAPESGSVPETTETVTSLEESAEATEAAVPETAEETIGEATEVTLPESVRAVQALIDALPAPETVTAEDYDAVQDAYDAYEALTDEEKALIQGVKVFEALFNWFNEQVETLDTVASGTCGENLTWVLDEDGTLTISGTGAMEDYTWSEQAPWETNRSSITAVFIKDGVTSIGSHAFRDCTSLESTTIPASVTGIGSSAFYRCHSLTSITIPTSVTSISDDAFGFCISLTGITIPEGVTSIGSYAFAGCRSLTSITIPEGVTSIGRYAFSRCSGLTSITIPESVTSIGDYVFQECTSLESITIPKGVTSIGDYAFSDCSSLTSITIPGGVTSIGYSAFSGCTKLTNVTLVEGLTTIGSNAFLGCTSLESIVIPASVTSIGTRAFYGCTELTDLQVAEGNESYTIQNGILFSKDGTTLVQVIGTLSGDYIIPDGVTSIGDYAFYHCSSLTSITIPESVTSIGGSAFGGCSSLTSVTIPEGVTYIGDRAFYGCSSLTSVTIPESVISIGEATFGNCSRLTGIWVAEGNESYVSEDGVLYYFDGIIAVPGGITGAFIIPETVTWLGGSSFDGCSSLTSITIPASVTEIGDSAFKDCTSLTDVYFTGTREQWNDISIYSGNDNLTNSTIHYGSDISGDCGDNLTWALDSEGTLTISGTGAMEDYYWDGDEQAPWYSERSSITSVVIEMGVDHIGKYAFYQCNNLTDVTIPESVTSIGWSAFQECSSLTGITIPESVTSIDDYVFEDSGLEWIAIPESVTAIGYMAFDGCYSLTSVTIPGSVTTIGDYAFGSCDALKDIHFAHRSWDPLEIKSHAFATNTWYRELRLFVSNLNDIPKAISGYNWDVRYQEVTYCAETASNSRPITDITLTQLEQTTEAEVGVPVSYGIQVVPAGTTSDILWSIIPGTGTATVTRQGVVTGLTAGTVTVRVASGDDAAIYAEASLTILPPTGGEPTAITVTAGGRYENEMAVDETIPMQVIFTPANASSRNVTWEVQNGTGTAKIDENGNLTGLTPGAVTVYATTANGIENSCTVNVVRYAESIQIFLDGKSDTTSMGIGETKYLTAVLTPENTTTTEVEWWIVRGTGDVELDWDNNYYYDGGKTTVTWITGTEAGTVTLCAAAKDSHAIVATVDLEITDTVQPYGVNGGNIYYNTKTGWITGSDDTVTDAVIPSVINGTTIVGIASDAFADVNNSWHNYYKNTTLTSVSIPATVKEIGRRAFYNCTALSNLRFAGTSQLTTIGEGAFYDCESLTNLIIPESVTTVGSQAFSGLSGLKYLTIPGEADSRSWGFRYYGEGNLETITYTGSFIRGGTCTVYEEGYRKMEPGVFCYAPKLILSDSVTAIGDYAFAGASGVTEVVLGANVASIGKGAFSNCYNLAKIDLSDSLSFLGEGCFKNCQKLEALEITGLPERFSANELCLTDTVQVPAWMQTATGNRASLEWNLEWPADGSDPYEVADCYKRTDGKYYLYIRGTGTVMLFCEESYTGLQTSKTITVAAGLEIRPADLTCLSSDQKQQLSAYIMPAGKKVSAYWYLNDGDEAFATLTSSGMLTAKTVTEPTGITVNAISEQDGTSATMTITILPKAESIALTLEGVPVTEDLVLDMKAVPALTLGTQILPEGAQEAVTWTTSNKSIATVDETGKVTLLKPGTVTITATTTDGSKQSAKVKLTVYYVDESKTLTAASDAPAQGLEPGQTATVTVKGSDKLNAGDLYFSIPASQQKIATVDEDTGVVTAGTTPGTVTVTATLRDDPLKRTATVKIKVIAMQAQELTLSTDIPAQTHDDQPLVILDAADGKTEAYSFTVSSQAQGYDGNIFSADVTWASSNTAIATVKAGKNGTATVTVKKGASGECAITATAKDLNKVTATLWLSVRDYQPRLESSSLSMNLYQTSKVETALLVSYDNTIESVSIDGDFTADWNDGILTITADSSITKGTYTQTLTVTCANGEPYPYTLKIKVTETEPTITVKQSGKYNLFYTDGTATLNVTVKDEVVEDVTVTDGDFYGEYEDGVLTLTANGDAAPGKKVELRIEVAGWEKPVAKTVTLATVTTAPKLKLSATSSTINTALSADHSTSFQVLDGTEVLTLEERDIDYSGSFADWILDSGSSITLTLNEEKGGTATLNIQKSNWTKAVKLTHKVTVQEAPPTLKLAASTLKLNRVFPEQMAATAVSLSQGNLTLSGLEITSTAKEGTALADEAAKLSVAWDADNGITATILDDTIKTGTYAFSCVGTLETGDTLKAVTLKVTVSATNPKVKLASTTLKLNRYLAGAECVSTKVTAPAGYTLKDFDGMEETPLSYDDGLLTACLRDEEDLGGTYTIYPVLIPDGGSEPITLDAGLKVKVTTYHSSALSATVSTKGKLDTLDPDSAITCTVNLKNCTGPIEGISLSGRDGDLFCAEVDEDGKVLVKLLESQDYATDRNYKVTLDMTVCGMPVSKDISFKVTQSTLKITATPSTLTCYQAIGYGAATLKLTSPATAEFGDVTVGSATTAALREALGEDGMGFDYATGCVTLDLAHPGLLAPGKSYTLCLEVTPRNNATNVKPTQVKLTIKIQK